MREIIVDSSQYVGCCKIDTVYGFGHLSGRKPLTDDEWFDGLMKCSNEVVGPMITFANSTKENIGICTPRRFAIWLRAKGEEIQELKHKHITLYSFVPSKKFWKDYDNYKKKKYEQHNAEYQSSDTE